MKSILLLLGIAFCVASFALVAALIEYDSSKTSNGVEDSLRSPTVKVVLNSSSPDVKPAAEPPLNSEPESDKKRREQWERFQGKPQQAYFDSNDGFDSMRQLQSLYRIMRGVSFSDRRFWENVDKTKRIIRERQYKFAPRAFSPLTEYEWAELSTEADEKRWPGSL